MSVPSTSHFSNPFKGPTMLSSLLLDSEFESPRLTVRLLELWINTMMDVSYLTVT